MSLYPFISDIWRLSENWLFLFLWVIKDQTVLSMPSRKTSMDKLKSGCSIIEFPQHAILNPIMKQSSQMILVLIWSELYRAPCRALQCASVLKVISFVFRLKLSLEQELACLLHFAKMWPNYFWKCQKRKFLSKTNFTWYVFWKKKHLLKSVENRISNTTWKRLWPICATASLVHRTSVLYFIINELRADSDQARVHP